jgi:hypothetical protein
MKKLHTTDNTQISRRMLLAGGVAASATVLAATGANATIRVSKDSVKFATTATNGHNCGSCKQFLSPSDCRFVQGHTSADCSCWIWQSKIG